MLNEFIVTVERRDVGNTIDKSDRDKKVGVTHIAGRRATK
jgi:hypothetical protein